MCPFPYIHSFTHPSHHELTCLMSSSLFPFVLLEPTLFGWGRLASGRLTLDFNRLSLVRLQLASQVGLFRGWWRFRDTEFLNVRFGITRFGRGGFESTELLEVKVLHEVCYKSQLDARLHNFGDKSASLSLPLVKVSYSPFRTGEVMKFRRATGTVCRDARRNKDCCTQASRSVKNS